MATFRVATQCIDACIGVNTFVRKFALPMPALQGLAAGQIIAVRGLQNTSKTKY